MLRRTSAGTSAWSQTCAIGDAQIVLDYARANGDNPFGNVGAFAQTLSRPARRPQAPSCADDAAKVIQIEATYAHLFGEHLERSRTALEAFDAISSGAYGRETGAVD